MGKRAGRNMTRKPFFEDNSAEFVCSFVRMVSVLVIETQDAVEFNMTVVRKPLATAVKMVPARNPTWRACRLTREEELM